MAIFHLHASTGSRTGGQSARAKIDYLSRGGRYAEDGDEVLHIESGNMPAWGVQGHNDRVRDAAVAYWRAVDQHERANGRLYKHLQVGLPHELPLDAQIRLLRNFSKDRASDGINGGVLPFTFTIHRGKGKNIHGDIVLSERITDGHARAPATWFRRAAASPKGRTVDPAAGGARKSELLKQKGWLLETRRKWAEAVNDALSAANIGPAVDHQSLRAQGIDAVPTVHIGVRAAAMMRREVHADRAAVNVNLLSFNAQWRRMRAEVARRREEEEEAAAALVRVRQEIIDATMNVLLESKTPMAWDAGIQTEERLADKLKQRPGLMPQQQKVDMQNDAGQRQDDLEEGSSNYYGKTPPLSAQNWKMRSIRQREEILFERDDGRLLDMGTVIVAEHGHDVEVTAMIKLIGQRGWQAVRFTGGDDFLRRAMTAALEQAIPLTMDSEHEKQIFIEVQHDLHLGALLLGHGRCHP